MLSDDSKRRHYDRYGSVDGQSPFAATDVTGATEFFDALFGDLFGLQRRKSSAGRDLRYTLELDFEEAALGCEKVLAFERPEECAACSGTGAEGGDAGLVTCPRCGGEGVIRKKAGFLTSRRDCMGCGGTGKVPRVRCATCEGAGLLDKERRYTVRIPAGSTGGTTQRVPREGGPGRRGGPPGDLHVIVRVRPHAFFTREPTRDGDVLTIEVPLSQVEAALGAGAGTRRAVFGALEHDRLLAAHRRLFEVQLQRVAQVASVAAAPPPQPELVAEDGVEELGGAGDVRAAERRGSVDRAVAVVARSLVLVGQHGVGERQLLEPLLGRLVAGVPVGVPPERELAVRRLDLDVARVARHAEQLVVLAGQGGYAPSGGGDLDDLDDDLGPGPVDTETRAGRSSRSPTR